MAVISTLQIRPSMKRRITLACTKDPEHFIDGRSGSPDPHPSLLRMQKVARSLSATTLARKYLEDAQRHFHQYEIHLDEYRQEMMSIAGVLVDALGISLLIEPYDPEGVLEDYLSVVEGRTAQINTHMTFVAAFVSIVADVLPLVGDVKGAVETVRGEDILGEELDVFERGLGGAILLRSA